MELIAKREQYEEMKLTDYLQVEHLTPCQKLKHSQQHDDMQPSPIDSHNDDDVDHQLVG